MTLTLDGFKSKIDLDFTEFRDPEDLDNWLQSFQEIVEYVKEKSNNITL